MHLDTLPAFLDERVNDFFAKKAFSSVSKSNRSSAIGHDCIRYLCYERRPEALQKTPPSVGLLKIFNEGVIQEKAVVQTLQEAGFSFIKSQNEYMDQEHLISGHIDGFLEVGKESILAEIKSVSPHLFPGIKSVSDMMNSRMPWFRHYATQINIYMWLSNTFQSLFILKNKTSGELSYIPAERDEEIIAEAKAKAASINSYLSKGELPKQIDDWETCAECNYKHLCLTEIDFGKEDCHIVNRDLENDLNRLDEMKSYKKEIEILEDRIKHTVKGLNGVVCGNWRITGKEVELKPRYTPGCVYWKSTKKKIEVK